MKKIINIIFCPQDIEDTQAAIDEARRLIEAGETVALDGSETNLIDVACLALLTKWGFRYSAFVNRFVKEMKND